ncbi:MAG: hypothetical protein EXS01_05080 [Phycisphaerales bacterium]|nr:hypothetical protein [Phycisphaerales bacterium]
MMYRSFVDLVFIILCALIVVLAEAGTDSLRGLSADPADVGDQGTHELDDGGFEFLVVSEVGFIVRDTHFTKVADALNLLDPGLAVVVVPESSLLSHDRVIGAWWEARQSGRHVELGVRTDANGSQS